MRQEIGTYKALRDALPDQSARLLSLQVDDDPSGGWDALQESSTTTGNAVIFAFENPGAGETTTVHPQALGSDTLYDVVSVDVGSIGQARGDELMSSGITIFSSPGSRAHVLQIRARRAVGRRAVIASGAPTFLGGALFAGSTLPSWKKVCIMNS